jgi:very-short-patch-repair endonuclease
MEYSCTICNKEFKTKQSLGGHVSSHNRGESYLKSRQTKASKLKRETKNDPKTCTYCESEFENGWKLGAHIIHCDSNPTSKTIGDKISKSNTGRSLSKTHKQNVSESMKLAHKEGRAWNIGQSRWNNEPSYPEKFFMKVIENEFTDKDYIQEFPIGKYSIDFAWTHLNKAIEIDGSQHDRFKEYKDRDILKDKLLIEKGWLVLRIKWKDMYDDPKKFIRIAKEFIHIK